MLSSLLYSNLHIQFNSPFTLSTFLRNGKFVVILVICTVCLNIMLPQSHATLKGSLQSSIFQAIRPFIRRSAILLTKPSDEGSQLAASNRFSCIFRSLHQLKERCLRKRSTLDPRNLLFFKKIHMFSMSSGYQPSTINVFSRNCSMTACIYDAMSYEL